MSLDATIRYLQRRTGALCNCHHPYCWIDTACHALRLRWRWVCDKHDAYILRIDG